MSAQHEEDHPVHVPQPSLSPPILALGVMLMALGIIFGVALVVVGALIFVLGIATWLIDDARAYVRAGDPSGGAHH